MPASQMSQCLADQPALAAEQPLRTFLYVRHTLKALHCRAMHALSVAVPRMLTGLNADALANIDTPSSALVQALVLLVHASLRHCACQMQCCRARRACDIHTHFDMDGEDSGVQSVLSTFLTPLQHFRNNINTDGAFLEHGLC